MVRQHHTQPDRSRQLCQRAIQIERNAGSAFHGRLGRRCIAVQLEQRILAPQMFEPGVHGDGLQPGRQRLCGAQVRQRISGLQQHLLRQIIRERAIVTQATQQIAQPLLVACDQHRKRFLVLVARQQHQDFIAGSCVGAGICMSDSIPRRLLFGLFPQVFLVRLQPAEMTIEEGQRAQPQQGPGHGGA